jgi:hypothetical protein
MMLVVPWQVVVGLGMGGGGRPYIEVQCLAIYKNTDTDTFSNF